MCFGLGERPSSGTPNQSATNNTNNEPEVLPAAPLFASSDGSDMVLKISMGAFYDLQATLQTFREAINKMSGSTDEDKIKMINIYNTLYDEVVSYADHDPNQRLQLSNGGAVEQIQSGLLHWPE